MINIENLLIEKVQENQNLEYKNYFFKDGKFNYLDQRQRNALLKEVCAFANGARWNNYYRNRRRRKT